MGRIVPRKGGTCKARTIACPRRSLGAAALKVPGTPEERHYTVVADEEIGQPSPAVTVVVK